MLAALKSRPTTRSASRFLGRSLESSGEITSREPPRKRSYKKTSGSISGTSLWVFEAEEDGTRLTFSGEVEAGGTFKVAEAVVGKLLDKQIPSDMSALRLRLEAELV